MLIPKGDIEGGTARGPVTAVFIDPAAGPASSVGRKRKMARDVAAEGLLRIIGQADVGRTTVLVQAAWQSKPGLTREGLHARIAVHPKPAETRSRLVVS